MYILREILAEYAHDAWSGWMEYMLSKCEQCDGGIFMPQWAYERWTRQKNTPYKQLPEKEKNSDREEADKILSIFHPLEDALRARIAELERENEQLVSLAELINRSTNKKP